MSETITPIGKSVHRRTLGWVLLEFLGSMNLAITLLVVVAVSSIIGTVLQQNQPYPNYVIKFGPFWFEVFNRLGLYDVYGAGWFIAILAFLILSTSVCIYRQAPGKLREMLRFRTRIRADSLRGFHQCVEWRLPERDLKAVLTEVTGAFHAFGYRWRVQNYSDHQVAAAMKGRYNRLGYLFTHAAVVIIGIGGLLDGNLWLKLKEWRGEIALETRDLAARDIPPISRLAPGAVSAFRGNVMLPEGSAANFVFLRLRDGFLLQELPFAIELRDFQVEYHATGQPKSFTSQVRIHDQDHLGDTPLEATIQVNHPLVYRGYAIYQSDFGDGGSKLELRAWPLTTARADPVETQGEIGSVLKVAGPTGAIRLELDDFRLFNLLPEPGAQPGDRKFRNFGPSVGFKLRDAAGEAHEYLNYMTPVQLEGRWFFISGARAQPGAEFMYLHIPVDANNSPERFLRFNARLHDADGLRTVLARSAPSVEGQSPDFQRDLDQVRLNLVGLFAQGGFAAVTQKAQAVVPADRLKEATGLYLNILRDTLAEVFLDVLREEGVKLEQGVGEREDAFFNDALSALAALPAYGSPFYLQLTRFQQVEASGLQVTHSNATGMVYTGFAFLVIGIFIMFYTSYRRLWAWLALEDNGVRLILAGAAHRHSAEFTGEFNALQADLIRRLGSPEAVVEITVPPPDTAEAVALQPFIRDTERSTSNGSHS
ncbi:cytochrome c biogenesis protein ResB [Candidatus Contendibacter odensensis]|uniref:ResB protein required for cytochrome c biosynthesis n=1 Tax=Candidatus Contendobacter odensis Run_B_J11 TaxID=1400861 RepID=A0A7U7GDX5_9GAMM|nr:cytochrome c biogenesis protein ResB [Candidatus Contendobacter odensis]CDH46034.1 putative ResB protein required for cytochrome c biosynthesis [Candidatus Contendobacter odensis Run_B_J11]